MKHKPADFKRLNCICDTSCYCDRLAEVETIHFILHDVSGQIEERLIKSDFGSFAKDGNSLHSRNEMIEMAKKAIDENDIVGALALLTLSTNCL